MRTTTFGDGDDDLVLVLGWGNRFEHPGVEWLIEQFADEYTIHGFQLPITIRDFEEEYLDPVRSVTDGLDEYRLLTHSTGGLIGAFLDDYETAVHCSPWWGFHDSLDNPVVSLLMRVPIATPILPAGIEQDALGELTTDERYADNPSRAAPTFLREVYRAQQRLPPFDTERASVFYSPTDAVVNTGTIEARVPESHRVTYDGGHELFASRCRDEHIETIRRALATGPSALDRESSERKP
ncbi:MAG: alpha/beta hydrolase [Halobacteriales archaeon]|nr:alpha/beta hydrolase [Halobacteriales archaeon]